MTEINSPFKKGQQFIHKKTGRSCTIRYTYWGGYPEVLKIVVVWLPDRWTEGTYSENDFNMEFEEEIIPFT